LGHSCFAVEAAAGARNALAAVCIIQDVAANAFALGCLGAILADGTLGSAHRSLRFEIAVLGQPVAGAADARFSIAGCLDADRTFVVLGIGVGAEVAVDAEAAVAALACGASSFARDTAIHEFFHDLRHTNLLFVVVVFVRAVIALAFIIPIADLAIGFFCHARVVVKVAEEIGFALRRALTKIASDAVGLAASALSLGAVQPAHRAGISAGALVGASLT